MLSFPKSLLSEIWAKETRHKQISKIREVRSSGKDKEDIDVYSCFHVTGVLEMGQQALLRAVPGQGAPWQEQGNGVLQVI